MFPSKIPIISQPPSYTNLYSINFDGTDDFVNIPQNGTNLPSGADPRTLSCWVKRASSGNAAAGSESIVQYGHENTNQQFALVLWTESTNLYFAGWSNDLDTGIDIADTNWHHLVVTFDGTTIIVYKDGGTAASGEQDSSTAGDLNNWTNLNTTLNDDNGGFAIGRRGTGYGGAYFSGRVDDVAIWDAVLSAADVAAIYNSGVPNDLTNSGSYDTDRTGNLVGYWRLEEGTGTSVLDSSSEGNTGTINGDPSYSTEVPS